jgi:hypothetical protein
MTAVEFYAVILPGEYVREVMLRHDAIVKLVRDPIRRARWSPRSATPGGKRLLPAVQNAYVDALILDHFLLDDLFKGATKEKLVRRCKRDMMEARVKFRSGDSFTMLRAVLRPLTVLRNRVMHDLRGSPEGLPSVVKGARVAHALVPASCQLMATYGHGGSWDPIPYPRSGFADPRQKLETE